MTYTEALKLVIREAAEGMQKKVDNCPKDQKEKMFPQVSEFMLAQIMVNDLFQLVKGQ